MEKSDQLRWVLLEFVQRHPVVEIYYPASVTVLFLIFLLCSLAPFLLQILSGPPQIPSGKMQSGHRAIHMTGLALESRGFYLLVLSLFVCWTRFPTLLPGLQNPDEGLFSAAAMKLLVDPVFWRSAEAGSSGPLNILPLLLPAAFGWSPDLASSRVMGILLMTGAIIFSYLALSNIFSEAIARLSVLLTTVTLATFTTGHLSHSVSESSSIFILSVALVFFSRLYVMDQPNRKNIFLLGFVLGLTPYAKMQSVPVAALVGLLSVHVLWSKNHFLNKKFFYDIGCLAIGGVLFSLIMLLYLYIFSITQKFIDAYLQANLLIYLMMDVSEHAHLTVPGFFDRVSQAALMLLSSRELRPLILTVLMFLGIAIIMLFMIFFNKQKATIKNNMIGIYSILMLLVSFFVIQHPGLILFHYGYFILIPAIWVIAFCVYSFNAIKSRYFVLSMALVLVCISVAHLYQFVTKPNIHLSNDDYYRENYRSRLADIVLSYAKPGQLIEVWGWTPILYVETGLLPATSHAYSSPMTEHYPPSLMAFRNRWVTDYMNQLKTARPILFVDTVARGMFFFPGKLDVKKRGHQAVPEVADYVRKHYRLVRTYRGVKIFKRKIDLPSDSAS
jgi:hypothetical protein